MKVFIFLNMIISRNQLAKWVEYASVTSYCFFIVSSFSSSDFAIFCVFQVPINLRVFFSQNLEGSHFPMIPKSVLNLLEAKAVSQLSLCQSVDKIMEMLDVTSNEHDEDANEGF